MNITAVLRCLLSADSVKAAKNANLVPFLREKVLIFVKFCINFSQKAQIEQFSSPPLFSKIRSITLPLKFKIFLAKLTKIWSKVAENVNKNNGIHSTFLKV